MALLAIPRLAFLVPGNYDDADPRNGLEETLALLSEGEALGFDGAWVRQRHLEPGISSAATFLAAATQRTRRIGLGVAVIQMGYENPFRLAEDLSLVDVLSGGRLEVGLSAGPPPHGSLLGERFHDGEPTAVDVSHGRVGRLAANLDVQARHVATFRAHWRGAGAPRIAVGRVILPTDGADAATRERYRAFAAGRHARTLAPQGGQAKGERRTLFAPDLVGPAAELVERLRADPILPFADTLRVELPYNFAAADYRQILADVASLVAPRLGWSAA